MKLSKIVMGLVLAMVTTCLAKPINPIVPKPVKASYSNQKFILTASSKIVVKSNHKAARKAAKFLQRFLADKGLKLAIVKSGSGIVFSNLDKKLPADGYTLNVSKGGVTVKAADYGGFFYGIQSILQLMPSESFAKLGGKTPITCAKITDYPRFNWRGMMLGCSRQFFTKEQVLRYIDTMAYHKLNIFHWHLTDDDGWRIEIKKYPLLTEKGAWRGKNCVLPASRGSSKDEVYGGFYSQKDIKEIVKYALDRNINILPEIDVPGHSLAVTKSYPKTLCVGADESKSVQGIKQNTWCAGQKHNFSMLNDIIKEVADLFPFDYIHIGGDEVNQGPWKSCQHCQALMKEQEMKHVGAIQNYFIRKMEGIVTSNGKKMIGWNEILHGGKLSPDTNIMSWIGVGPGIHAAKLGHKVIMTPGPYTYFDMAQYPGERGHWWAGVVSARKCYSYNPLGDIDLPAEQLRNIFGVQGCLWSEFLDNPKDYVWYQTYPRLCALSEVAWTPQADRDWDTFMATMGKFHLDRLAALNINFRVPDPVLYQDGDMAFIEKPYPTAEVRYTLDGSEPTKKSALYKAEFEKKPYEKLQARTFTKSGRMGRVIKKIVSRPIALWEPKMLSKTEKVWKFDVSKNIQQKGKYSLSLELTSGDEVSFAGAKLLRNGKVISAIDRVENVYRKSKNRPAKMSALYIFKLNKFKPGKFELQLPAKAVRNSSSYGRIVLSLDDRLTAPASVIANLPTQKGKEKETLVDWNPSTWMWVSRAMKKGETVTIVFDKPLKCQSIDCRSGKPNTTDDILIDSDLEFSNDGKSFYKVADFTFGTAKAKTNGKAIKAVRIKVLKNQSTWNAIQDLIIK